MNFIYDNTNGYIGYIWNGQSGGNIGFVKPATTSSATTVSASTNPAIHGKMVTFIATVAASSPHTPTGSVTFMIDENFNYIPLNNNGKATFSTSELSVGEHIIVAKSSGDSTYIRSASSTLVKC